MMVVSMTRRPLQRIALHRQRAAVRQDVLEPLGRAERLVGDLSVIAQRDAETTGDEVHGQEALESAPGEGKRSEQTSEMHSTDETHVRDVGGDPFSEKRVSLWTRQNIRKQHLVRRLDARPRPLRRRRPLIIHRAPQLTRPIDARLTESFPHDLIIALVAESDDTRRRHRARPRRLADVRAANCARFPRRAYSHDAHVSHRCTHTAHHTVPSRPRVSLALVLALRPRDRRQARRDDEIPTHSSVPARVSPASRIPRARVPSTRRARAGAFRRLARAESRPSRARAKIPARHRHPRSNAMDE